MRDDRHIPTPKVTNAENRLYMEVQEGVDTKMRNNPPIQTPKVTYVENQLYMEFQQDAPGSSEL